LKRLCRNCRVVKHFQSVSCRILKQDEIGNVTFTGQPARAAVNRNTVRLQPRRECVERRRVSHLPPEEAQSFGLVCRDDQALLSVIHAESTHRAGAIYALHAE
jgi:hypothetical protein